MENRFQYEGGLAFVDAWRASMQIEPDQFLGLMNESLPGKIRVAEAWIDGETLRYTLRHTYNGQHILQTERLLNTETRTMFHGLMEVEEPFQRKGWNAVVSRNSIALYRQIGITRVETNPGLNVGGYTNARLGFTPVDRAAWETLKSQLWTKYRAIRPSLPLEVQSAIERTLRSPDLIEVLRIAYLDETFGNRDTKFSRRLLIGTNWSAKLDLTDELASGVFDDYVDGEEVDTHGY